MREQIKDLLKHVSSVGIEVFRVTGTSEVTKIEAVDDDKVLLIQATLNEPIADLSGVFGVSNLKLLNGLLSFTSYNTDKSTVKVLRRDIDGESIPSTLVFTDGNGGSASYRFMPPSVVPKQGKIENIPWDMTFNVTAAKGNVKEFSQLASLYSEIDDFFSVRVENDNLVFGVGGTSETEHLASMVFEPDVNGSLRGNLQWSISSFLSIMKLAGNEAVVHISSRGVLAIVVNTAFASYTYFLRSRNK